MYAGLALSLLFHVGILAWAFLSLQSRPNLDLPEAVTIEAELITPAEFTRLKKGDPNAKKLEAKAKDKPEPKVSKKKAPKPKPPKAAPPPPKEAAIKEKPKPVIDPIAQKIAQEKKRLAEKKARDKAKKEAAEKAKKIAAEKAKKEAKRKAREKAKKKAAEKKRKERAAKKRRERERKRKAKAKKKKDFAESMKALLDKTPEKRGGPQSASVSEKPTDYTGPTAGEREGSGSLLTAREEDLLKGRISAQLRDCWRLPGGGGGSQLPVVTLKWSLRPNGTLNSFPRVEGGRSDPAFKIAAESAIRAVTQCAPFDLPAKYYNSWKTIIWDFDPQHML